MVGPLGKLGMPLSKQVPFKLATIQDIPELLSLCEQAHKESPHELRLDREQIFSSLHEIIEKGVIICYVQDNRIVGLIGGITTFTIMSLEKVGAELLWFVHPDYRRSRNALKLLTAFEYWCWSQDCKAITLGNMPNDSFEATKKFYTRKGYKLIEMAYMKRIR